MVVRSAAETGQSPQPMRGRQRAGLGAAVAWLVAALGVALVTVACAAGDADAAVGLTPRSRFAYVAIHYEGTPKDDEYAFGLRVLIKSLTLSGTEQDIVVLISDSVRQSTRDMITAAGAIAHVIPNIPNPYKDSLTRRRSYKPRFEYTFNKLYLWNMTEYERVAYLDIDNIAPHNIDEVFLCGHFCVVYMNPVLFHTGLLIVKPDTKAFEDHMTALRTLDSFSHDGADQGFLTSRYADMDAAPLFDVNALIADGRRASMTPMEAPLMRMSSIYNFNAVYELYKCNLERLSRENHPIASDELPALTIGFPITPPAKPWYWWPTFFFTLYWRSWHRIREQLPDAYGHMDFAELLMGLGLCIVVAFNWNRISALPVIRSSAFRVSVLVFFSYWLVMRLDEWYWGSITPLTVAFIAIVVALSMLARGDCLRLAAAVSSGPPHASPLRSKSWWVWCSAGVAEPHARFSIPSTRRTPKSLPVQHSNCFAYPYGVAAVMLTLFVPMAFVPRFIHPLYGWCLYFPMHWFASALSLNYFAVSVMRLRWLPGDEGAPIASPARDAAAIELTAAGGTTGTVAVTTITAEGTGATAAVGGGGGGAAASEAERDRLWGWSIGFQYLVRMMAFDLFAFFCVQHTAWHWSFVEKITAMVWLYCFALFQKIAMYPALANAPSTVAPDALDAHPRAPRRTAHAV